MTISQSIHVAANDSILFLFYPSPSFVVFHPRKSYKTSSIIFTSTAGKKEFLDNLEDLHKS